MTLLALIALNVVVSLAGFRVLNDDPRRAESFLFIPNQVARGENGLGMLLAHFAHAGFGHLLFNMFALYVLGSLLEPAVGRFRFGLIYFVSLLAGSFGALLLSPNSPTVGASGAIFGLMGAAVIVMRNRGLSPMESGLGFWIVLNLVITFTVPNISIGGHIGGLLGGGLAALLLFNLRDQVRLPDLVPTILVAALGVAAVVGSIAVSSTPG
jgi:membrane associated rhomboid family serine protease